MEAEYISDAGYIKGTPYLTLTGKLWGVFCAYLWENWLSYNGTALYLQDFSHFVPPSLCFNHNLHINMTPKN